MKKLRLKRIWIILLLIIILLLSYPTFLIIKVTSNNYNFKTSIKIIKNNLVDFTVNNDYSKTFDEAINSQSFNKKYIEKYIKIDFNDDKDFIKNINTFISKGYTESNINIIYKKLNLNQIEKLKDHNTINDIDKYLNIDFFNYDDLDRYITYFEKNKDYEKTILYVNMGLDKEYYKDPNIVNDFSQTMIANKYNKLNESFVPPEITKISEGCSRGNQELSKIAAEAFEKMCKDAKKDKIYLLANSSYRSFKSQKETYDYYYKLYGKKYVNDYVATPGYSEHQTGLAVDVASKNYSPFKSSPEYKWMLKNSYKYGFILRYPEEKENLTGYNSESWHFRYVGLDVSKYIFEKNITFDEYYAMFLYAKKN